MIFLVYGAVSALLLSGVEQGSGAPFPRVQAVPLPEGQVAFEIDGVEAARYHYGASVLRPYLFPLIGPAGQRVTRLGHPHDPHGHRHHRSIWIGHRDVNGVSFWEEPGGRIVQERIASVSDGPDAASLVVRLSWRDTGGKALLDERRTMTLRALPDGELLLDIALELKPVEGPVTLGKTPFGFLGVRVAKTMSVHDGGGMIRNSEGGVNEAGVHWKRARWVDYAGRVAPATRNGIAFLDHPGNPRSPTYFHVRDDGWMGASFTYAEPYKLAPDESLIFRYRLYVHGPDTTPESIESRWNEFAEEGPCARK